jgi:hypothetical protein
MLLIGFCVGVEWETELECFASVKAAAMEPLAGATGKRT